VAQPVTTAPGGRPIGLLMLTSSFPPLVDSGTQRPLGFVRHLAEAGFKVAVATLAHENRLQDPSLLRGIPPSVRIERVLLRWAGHGGRQGGRQLPGGLQRRIWNALRPIARRWPIERWRVRWPPLVDLCRNLIAEERPDVLWATGPHFEALQVGAHLAARYRLPFVADYRDPWTYGFLSRAKGCIGAWFERAEEARVLRRARTVVFASPLTAKVYRRLYPRCADRFISIPSGFEGGDVIVSDPSVGRREKIVVSYVGRTSAIRRPEALLAGLRLLVERHPELAARLSVRFTGECQEVTSLVAAAGLEGIVRVEGPVSYEESRRVMRDSDVLLLLQTLEGPGSDVISGKLYEYLAARRPILGVISPHGGDAWLLKQSGAGVVAGLSPEGICAAFVGLHEDRGRQDGRAGADPGWLEQFEWRTLTTQLAQVLVEAAAVRR